VKILLKTPKGIRYNFAVEELLSGYKSTEISGKWEVRAIDQTNWETVESFLSRVGLIMPTKDQTQGMEITAEAASGILNSLSQYILRPIGVNFKKPNQYNKAILLHLSRDSFTIQPAETDYKITFPIRNIISISEYKNGFYSDGVISEQFDVVVQVYQMVFYSGAVGVSFGFPI
jgi:hypothetical protein